MRKYAAAILAAAAAAALCGCVETRETARLTPPSALTGGEVYASFPTGGARQEARSGETGGVTIDYPPDPPDVPALFPGEPG
ncbi:MAG: hypothetical protein IJU66_05730, partial [Oscillospiraceae bacterium]|nr:hypothetical protein [Oscillospiraceae bacterium]